MNWRKHLRAIWETFAAYGRQGAKEMGSVFYGPGTNAQPPEYGMAWTKTPGEIADGMRGKSALSQDRDHAPSLSIDARIERAAVVPEPTQQQERGFERD